MTTARIINDTEQLAEAIIEALGKQLVIALPLGLGKPLALVNALYRRAEADSSLSLTFLTALSLEIPQEQDPIRKRLLGPVFERVFEGCAEPAYAAAQTAGTLPKNISVKEFYVRPGSRLNNRRAQQDYVSSNYTHAARDVVANGCNLVLQLVAPGPMDAGVQRLSMSCNPDTALELSQRLKDTGRRFLSVAVCDPELPYMYGDAEVSTNHYHFVQTIADKPSRLFPLPKLQPADGTAHLIGLQASTLVKDGGSLQIGIGALGDAISYSLALRHNDNSAYRRALDMLGINDNAEKLITTDGGTAPFAAGLYGATEMFTEGFLDLLDAGVLRREVYDFWALQILINERRCDPDHLEAGVLAAMDELGVRELRGKDFDILQYHGFFTPDTRYQNGHITTPLGSTVPANMADPDSRKVLGEQALGERLVNGRVLHGGFYLGSSDFYHRLRSLSEPDRRRIAMTGVDRINQLDFNPRLYRAQRIHARFINTGMKVTLNGQVASDTLEDGRVVSGVGGQYNFVAMAHQLLTGRSVIMVRAARGSGSNAESNIVPHYGACTIPRHLRDIVVTEYGIADLRSKTDAQVAAALIEIADSRFQGQLIQQAKAAGKLPEDYRLPESARQNTPQACAKRYADISAGNYFPPFPGGSDFTEDELVLAKALQGAAATKSRGWLALLKSLRQAGKPTAAQEKLLSRLELSAPDGIQNKVLRRLVLSSLQKSG